MPILGVPASLGNRSSFVCWRRGCSCAFLNCSAMLGKAVRIRYCPATVSDVVFTSRKPLPQGGKVLGCRSQSQETGRAARCTCSSSEGKENRDEDT